MATTVSQEFTTPGTTTWTAPAGVSYVEVTMVGGGGGGGGTPNGGGPQGAGGGAGEFCFKQPYFVVGGNTYSVTVGAAGTGGPIASSVQLALGTAGEDSIFDNLRVRGGGAVTFNSAGGNQVGGNGGGTGGAIALTGNAGTIGACEIAAFVGGSSGGSAGAGRKDGGPSLNGFAGGPNGGAPVSGASGCGGGSSPWGQGGQGGFGDNNFDGHAPAATAYGAGGGGGGILTSGAGNQGAGGNGMSGYVLLQWESP